MSLSDSHFYKITLITEWRRMESRGKSGRRTNVETITVVRMRSDGGLDWGGGSRDGKKWMGLD